MKLRSGELRTCHLVGKKNKVQRICWDITIRTVILKLANSRICHLSTPARRWPYIFWRPDIIIDRSISCWSDRFVLYRQNRIVPE